MLFPGTPSAWIKVLPSYGVIQALWGHRYGQGWADILPYLAMAAAWSFALCPPGSSRWGGG